MAAGVLFSKADEVAARFPVALGRMQDLFQRYDLPMQDLDALPCVASLLRSDGIFRAELSGLLQTMLANDGRVSYLDLLGLLVVAAQGEPVDTASETTSRAVRIIMPFLIEVRRSAGQRRSEPSLADGQHGWSVRGPRAAGLALGVLALVLVTMSLHWRTAMPGSPNVTMAEATGTAAQPRVAQLAPSRQPVAEHQHGRRPALAGAEAPDIVRRNLGSQPRSISTTRSATVASSASVGPTAEPAAVATSRQPLQPRPVEPRPGVVPVNMVSDADARVLAGPVARTGVRPRVVPGVAGIMAANVLSSPAPAYPSQASAAGVEGEVVIEAVVGKDGDVIGTRIVSGPALLREAALRAVQRWRYRPFEVDGERSEIATTARLDFRLKPD